MDGKTHFGIKMLVLISLVFVTFLKGPRDLGKFKSSE